MSMRVNLDMAEITLKRYRNVKRLAQEYATGKTTLRALPLKLVIEATNVCNLNCPGCFTGLGENGRVRSSISMDLYHRVLKEIGDTLIEVEFFNWGEPLLCKSIYEMIAEASRRGIGTRIATNFSVPFDETKAEAIVKSGLKHLGVSLDGVSQEAYEKYRRQGKVDLVIRNVRLVADAKRRLGSLTPKITWSFHVFDHNVHEMDLARERWSELGFDELWFDKGLTIGDEWKDDRVPYYLSSFNPDPCHFLWHYAVIHNDGGAAPCCGTFYREDDLGRMSVKPGDSGASSFGELWNSKAYQDARALYAKGVKSAPPHMVGTVCGECPLSKVWGKFGTHVEAGGTRADFDPGYTAHDGFNYFLTRRPRGRDTRVILRPDREKKSANPST